MIMIDITGSSRTSLPADDIQHILLVEVVQQLECVSSTNENCLREETLLQYVIPPTWALLAARYGFSAV